MSDWNTVSGYDDNTEKWDWNLNPICQGLMVEVKHDVGQHNGDLMNVYNFEMNKVYTVWMNKVLNGKIEKVPPKSIVRAEFLGMRPPKSGGNPYKDYNVMWRNATQEEINKHQAYEMNSMNQVDAQPQPVTHHAAASAPVVSVQPAVEPHVQPQSPAPQPVAPAPNPVAPQPVAPAPVASPNPAPAAPAPSPVTGTVEVQSALPSNSVPQPQNPDEPGFSAEDLPF